LKEEYKFNQTYVKNVEQLSKKFAAWKRSRGDGNCYYRSVISSFIVKIFHPVYPEEYRNKFWQNLTELQHDPYFAAFLPNINYFINEISQLWHSENKLQEIHKKIAIKEFDQAMIFVSRALTLRYLLHKLQDPYYSLFFIDDDAELLKNNILVMGREAEAHELSLLPGALDIEVTHIYVPEPCLENIYPEVDNTGRKLKISVISTHRGLYDGFYSKQELEQESYDLIARDYNI
jgi:ubiquitin thioesterase protein OTUB1